MKLREVNIDNHCTGDIILTRGRSYISRLNMVGQTFISGEPTEFSHVLICASRGVYAEATNKMEVEMFSSSHSNKDVLDCEDWIVIRNKIVEKNTQLQNEICSLIKYQIGKKYNREDLGLLTLQRIFNKESNISNDINKNRAYCSEFVANIYREINKYLNCSLFNKSTSEILPVYISKLIEKDNILFDKNWYEVKAYKEKTSEVDYKSFDNLLDKEFVDIMRGSDELLNNFAGFQIESSKSTQEHIRSTNKILEKYDEILDDVNELFRTSEEHCLEIANLDQQQIKYLKDLINYDIELGEYYEYIYSCINKIKRGDPSKNNEKLNWEQCTTEKLMEKTENLEQKVYQKNVSFLNGQLSQIEDVINKFDYITEISHKNNENLSNEEIKELYNLVTEWLDAIKSLPLNKKSFFLENLKEFDPNRRDQLYILYFYTITMLLELDYKSISEFFYEVVENVQELVN